MKIKGFTLIELLAVIVILAIIALIATPIILNIIGNSKDSAVVRSGELYLDSVEQAIARKNLASSFSPTSCKIQSDGNLNCKNEILTVEISGSRPTRGTIQLSNGKILKVTNMSLDGYNLIKKENERLKILGKIIVNPKGSYLKSESNITSTEDSVLGGTIKRNQVESIEIKLTNKISSNAIDSWDASATGDSSVIVWYTDVDNNGLYELYIGGEGGVKANPNSSSLFKYFSKVKSIDVTYLDTSEVLNMDDMFQQYFGYNNFENELVTIKGIEWFNTDKITSMSNMFAGCSKLTSLDLSNFDTSNVTNMNSMFYSCKLLTTIDVSSFDTSKVTDMSGMFNTCRSLTTINISNFDTSKVTDMSNMFRTCVKITNLDLSNFYTNNLNRVSWMFYDCIALTTIDMRNVDFPDTSKIDYNEYRQMFKSNTSLSKIIIKDESAKTFIEDRLAEVDKTDVNIIVYNEA